MAGAWTLLIPTLHHIILPWGQFVTLQELLASLMQTEQLAHLPFSSEVDFSSRGSILGLFLLLFLLPSGRPEEAPHRSGMADTSNDCPQSTPGEG